MRNYLIAALVVAHVLGQIISKSANDRILRISNLNLHDYNIEHHWQQIIQKKQSALPTQLHIEQSTITQAGLLKLLQLNLTSLKIFNLTKCQLNPKVTKILFKQQFIYTLQSLILDFCNLQCQDFQSLSNKRANIRNLSLRGNYISARGFKYLTRLSMKLVSLDVQGNSLVDQDSVLSIIDFGLFELVDLNVGKTSILEQNLLKLLQKLNTDKLQNLTISSNTYSTAFYRKFTQIRFKSLRKLNLEDLMINHEALVHFISFKLSELRILIFNKNCLDDNYGSKFINKANMPNLETLSLDFNFVSSQFLKHLNNQGFQLKYLNLMSNTMDRNGLKELSKMSLQKLEGLQFTYWKINPVAVEDLFKKADFSNLKKLYLRSALNTGDIFRFMIRSNLKSIQELRLSQIGELSFDELSTPNIFPNLKTLTIVYSGNNCQVQRYLLQNIQFIAPSLQIFQIAVPNCGCLSESVLNGSIKYKIKKQLRLKILQVIDLLAPQHQIAVLQVDLEPNGTHKIIELQFSKLLIELMKYMWETNRIIKTNIFIANAQQSQVFETLHKYFNNFDISHIKILQDLPYLFMLKKLKRQTKQCLLESLESIDLFKINDQIWKFITMCKFPNLKHLKLGFISLQDMPSLKLDYPILNTIQLYNISTSNALYLFKNSKFQFLQKLVLPQIKLKDGDISQIITNIPYFQKVRKLDLSRNFLSQNLSILSSSHSRLQILILNQMMIKSALKTLCAVSFEFVQKLEIFKSGISDQSLISFIQCQLQNKRIIFPKIKRISFRQNYLSSQGIQKFMELDFPVLDDAEFSENNDPDLFNSIFSFDSSQRLRSFVAFENYLSGVDPNIKPQNTNKIVELRIFSKSFIDTDIQSISKFELGSLSKIVINVKNLRNCLSLSHLQKISKNADYVKILISKSEGINSSCLFKNQVTFGQALPQFIHLQIQTPYGEARSFVQFYLNPGQKLLGLVINGLYVSDSKIIEMIQHSDITKLQTLELTNNGLSDLSITPLLAKDYNFIIQINLAGNSLLSEKALSKMSNFLYQNLQILDFSGTGIGDQGVKHLVNNEFPKLKILNLKDSSISVDVMAYLNKLKAPALLSLDLSCNNLEVDDLLLLNFQNFQELRELVFYPRMSEQELNILFRHINRFKTGHSLKIKVQVLSTFYKNDPELQ